VAEWILDTKKCDLCVALPEIPCIKYCTVKMLVVQDSQLINLDKTKCMNCRYCRTECPRGAIKFR